MRCRGSLGQYCLALAIGLAALAEGSALAQATNQAAGESGLPAPGPTPHRYTPPPPLGGSRVSGKIQTIQGNELDLALRSGVIVKIDLTQAIKSHLAAVPFVGEYVQVEGQMSPQGRFMAQSLRRVKRSPGSWEPDIH